MLVILDWDGTLVNSEARIVRCLQVAAQRAGLPELAYEAGRNIIGLGLPEASRVLYPEASEAAREKLRLNYVEAWWALHDEPLAFFEGVLETLEALRDTGHQLAVATGKSRRGLTGQLEQMGVADLFVATRCADETASKPDPLMLQQLLLETGSPVEEALMVGDTEYDLAMAARINMASAGVTYGVHHRDRLVEHGPALILDSFSELLAWERLR